MFDFTDPTAQKAARFVVARNAFVRAVDFYGSPPRFRAVSFDIRNLAGIDLPSRPMSHGDDLGLPFDARSGESNFL